MAQFIDIHSGMKGINAAQLKGEHQKDKALEKTTGVHFIKSWADPSTGKVFCLSEGPSKEAVLRAHAQAGHPSDEIYEVSLMTE
jgi:hypothetical protein